MKRTWIAVLALSLILVFGQVAMAAGITLIPGSRDGEGALGEDGKSWGTIRGTTNIIMEGATSDAYEYTIAVPDPGSDITATMPSTTGTLSLVGGAGGTLADGKLYIGNNVGGGIAVAADVSGFFTIVNTGATTGTLADAKLWMGNSAGSAVAVTPSGKVAITNAGVTTLPDTTNTNIFVANGVTMESVTMSGDATITNAGALTLAADSVSVSQAFLNSVTLRVLATTTFNSVTVDSGHKLMGTYISTIGGINGANLVNLPAYDGAGVWTIAMRNALSTDAVWTLVFLSDN